MLQALGVLIDEGVIAIIHACCSWVDMSGVFIPLQSLYRITWSRASSSCSHLYVRCDTLTFTFIIWLGYLSSSVDGGRFVVCRSW